MSGRVFIGLLIHVLMRRAVAQYSSVRLKIEESLVRALWETLCCVLEQDTFPLSELVQPLTCPDMTVGMIKWDVNQQLEHTYAK